MASVTQVWQAGYEANRIKALISIGPDTEKLVKEIVIVVFYQLSLILSPHMKDEKRQELVRMAAGNFVRHYGGRFSITALVHAADLIINDQPPLNRKERFRTFDVTGLNGLLNKYLEEQTRRAKVGEEKPCSAYERNFLLAKHLAARPDVARRFQELRQQLQVKYCAEEMG